MADLPQKQSTTQLASQEGASYVLPYIDIHEDDEALYITADIPGVSNDKLKIDLQDDRLTIRGQVSPPQGELLLREYSVADYYRAFTLTDEIDQDKISARLENGVLELKLPKVEKAKARKITIQTQ